MLVVEHLTSNLHKKRFLISEIIDHVLKNLPTSSLLDYSIKIGFRRNCRRLFRDERWISSLIAVIKSAFWFLWNVF